MMKKILSIVLLLASWPLMAERVDVRSIGAVPDGVTLNTAVLQQAIDRMATQGGGALYFAAGNYLTGALHLCSNLTLELESGACLVFSDNFDHYLPYVDMRFEGIMMKSFSPLLYAVDQENITITGRGTLLGQGHKWWAEAGRIKPLAGKDAAAKPNKYQQMWQEANNVQALYADNDANFYPTLRRQFFRPPFIQLLRCRNIRIEGVTIKDSPFWTINPEFCHNVVVDGVTIINPPSPNTDGINPSSCKDVRISNCYISVGDDCITIKSGRDAQARRLAAPCENITITNCVMHAGHGGVVIGSEMSAGVRNVAISNCVFDGTDRGIRIKSRRGRGGVIEAVVVSNIVMRNIQKEAITIDLYYEGASDVATFDPERTPTVRNLYFNNIIAYQVQQPIMLRGLPESAIDQVSFSDMRFTSVQPCKFEHCTNIQMNQVWINGIAQQP